MTPLEPPSCADDITIGSLFAGYDGLGEGVRLAFGGGRLIWYSDVCKFNKDGTVGHHTPHRSPCSIMAHHHPGVPNYGDVSAIDWAALPRVHVLDGGSPCQDLSGAGRRAGMTEGTRSNLWVAMREGIAILRPNIVCWENVHGAFTAEADSALGSDPGLLGDLRPARPGQPVLRAAGRVLGDLSELAYDARVHVVRAADVGAPHGRLRVFVLATDSACDPWWESYGDRPAARAARAALLPDPPGRSNSRRRLVDLEDEEADEWTLLGTPTSRDWKDGASVDNVPENGLLGRQVVNRLSGRDLLPTPVVNDMGDGKDPDWWDEWAPRQKGVDGTGGGHGRSLAIEAARVLPTPTAQDAEASGGSTEQNVTLTDAVVRTDLGQQPNGRLLPTPRVGAERTSRGALTAEGHWSALSLAQSVELAQGILPREFEDSSELRGADAASADRLLPTPRATDGTKGGPNQAGSSGDLMLPSAVQPGRLLPSPRTTDAHTPGIHGNGGQDLRTEISLLPTPDAGSATRGGARPPGGRREAGHSVTLQDAIAGDALEHIRLGDREAAEQAVSRWGDYAPAINRWAGILGRPAPDPTIPNKLGNPQLSPLFVEWMMALAEGHVTGVPGISRNEALKALGNGVCPMQAAAAFAVMLTWPLP